MKKSALLIILFAAALLVACSSQPVFYPETSVIEESLTHAQAQLAYYPQIEDDLVESADVIEYMVDDCEQEYPNVSATTKCIYEDMPEKADEITVTRVSEDGTTIPAPMLNLTPWQEAYATLLRDYAMQVLGYSHCGTWSNQPGGSFILHDIDADGVPELIVVDRFHFSTYFAVYTFENNSVIPIEAEYFYDYGTSFFALSGGRPGIGMESNEGVWNSAATLVIEGYRLVPEVRLQRGEGIREELGETWEDFRIWWRINDTEVTEANHDEMYYQIFGHWHEREQIYGHEITEDNIRDIIFGWCPLSS